MEEVFILMIIIEEVSGLNATFISMILIIVVDCCNRNPPGYFPVNMETIFWVGVFSLIVFSNDPYAAVARRVPVRRRHVQ